MNRLMRWVACVTVALAGFVFVGSAAAAPLFSQCPPVGADTGCQYLLTVNSLGMSIATDPSQPSYASNLAATHETGIPTDALVGVQNNSAAPITSVNITGPITFEFDGDGICDNASGAVPKGCQAPSGSTACGPDPGPCSFAPPAGEPPNYTDFGALNGTPAWSNGDIQNGYEGPTSWFSNIGPSPNNSGTVNFSPAIPPGGSTYFSLEAEPKNLPFTTYLTASQTGAGLSGSVLYLPRGATVQDTAQLSGGTGHPTGHVTFALFHNTTCSGGSISAGTSTLPTATIESSPVPMNSAGTFYWQTVYAGDATNAPAVIGCGSQAVVVPRGAALGLPSNGRCVSELTAHVRVGKKPARAVEVFGNGKLLGHFPGKIRVRIHKHERVSVLASTTQGAFGRKLTSANLFRQQSRTYRACR